MNINFEKSDDVLMMNNYEIFLLKFNLKKHSPFPMSQNPRKRKQPDTGFESSENQQKRRRIVPNESISLDEAQNTPLPLDEEELFDDVIAAINEKYPKEPPLMDTKQIELWKINQYYPYLTKKKINECYYEYFNTDAMKWLLDNLMLLKDEWKIKNQSINQLLKYNAIAQCGWARIYYQKSKKYENNGTCISHYGRRFAYCMVSLQNLAKPLRATLCNNVWFEADIKNCHPTMVVDILEQNNCDATYTREYRDNREFHLQQLMEVNGITRKQAKDTFISVMYAGDHGSTLYNELPVKTEFIKNLKKEFINATEIVIKNNPQLYKDMQYTCIQRYNQRVQAWLRNNKRYQKPKKKNPKSSTMSYFIQTLENNILEITEEFLTKKKIIQPKQCTLIFDGVLVPIDKKEKFIKCIPQLQKIIQEKMKLVIQFDAKEWDKKKKNPEFLQCDELKNIYKFPNHRPWSERLNLIFSMEFKRFKLIAPTYEPLKDNDINANVTLNTQYLPSYKKWLEEQDTLIIKSRMGSGKTKRIYEYFRSLPKDKRILIVSFRRSLERKYVQDLGEDGFILYEDISQGTFNSKDHPKLVVQINSLWRVTGKYDIILLDEISYTFDTIIDYTKHKAEIVFALDIYLCKAEKVICLDAFITQANIDYINAKRKKKCVVVNNKYNKQVGTIQNMKEKIFVNKIIQSVQDGKKIVIASNIKKFLNEKLKPLLEEKNIKFLFVTSDNADEFENLDNIEEYQVFGYSPTIVAGLSYEKRNVFDYRFCYFSSASASPDICAQMLFRVRDTKEKKIFACIKQLDYNKNHPVLKEDIINWLEVYANLERKNEFKMVNARVLGLIRYNNWTRKYMKNAFFDVLVDYYRKRFIAHKNFGNRLMYYLGIQGWVSKEYKLHLEEKDDSEQLQEDSKKVLDQFRLEKNNATVQMYRDYEEQVPSFPEYTRLQDKKKKNEVDKVLINIFRIKEIFPSVEFSKLNDKQMKCIIDNWRAHRFLAGFKQSDKNDVMEYAFERVQMSKLLNQKDWHKQYQRDFFLRSYRCLQIIDELGFTDMNDFNNPISITNEMFFDVVQIFEDHYDDFVHLFGWKKKKDDCIFDKQQTFIQAVNKCLKNIGRKLKKKRIRKKNQPVEYKYELISTVCFATVENNIVIP